MVNTMKIWVLNPPYLRRYSRPQRSPAVTKSGTMYFPIWLAYCAGVLEEAGYEVILTDAPASGLGNGEILEMARCIRPDLVVMDGATPSIENDLAVARQIKEVWPEAFTALVGTHATALPEETLRAGPGIDAVARREYEYTIRELADALSGAPQRPVPAETLARIQGLSFRDGGGIVRNPDRPFIEDLDDLPWVAKVYRKHLRISDYFNPNAPYPMVTLVTSRGCAHRCSFCVYPQTLTGRKYRFRSIEDVMGELEFVSRAFPEAKSIFFEDDTLTANRKRCRRFCDAIVESGIRIPWVANSRIDPDLETLLRMKAAGCRELCVGFESGDPNVLDGMGKGIRPQQMFRFMADARKAGLLVHGCFMLGFPGETLSAVEKTIRLALDLFPDTAQFFPVMVYPGTDAYEAYRSKGWLTARRYSDWLTSEGLHNCVVRNERFGPDELVRLCDRARRRFYLRPRYLAYKLAKVMVSPTEAIRTGKAARVFFKHLVLGSRV